MKSTEKTQYMPSLALSAWPRPWRSLFTKTFALVLKRDINRKKSPRSERRGDRARVHDENLAVALRVATGGREESLVQRERTKITI
jgi:hypothetical protein